MTYTELSQINNRTLFKSSSVFEYMRATYAMAAACERCHLSDLDPSSQELLLINQIHTDLNLKRSQVPYNHTGEGITWV